MAKEKKEKFRANRTGIIFGSIIGVLIALSIVLACTVFFRVESIQLEGNEKYSDEEILSVASIPQGGNLILTPSDQIAQRICEALPYVEKVEVSKRLPTTLKVEITETKAVAVVAGAGSSWLIDAKGKLLEPADAALSEGVIYIEGLELLEPQQGEMAKTTPENAVRLEGVLGLFEALAQRPEIFERVLGVDVTSGTEMQVGYDGRIYIKLLNNADFESKMRALEQVLAIAGEDGRGTINMKASDRVIWTKTN